MSEIRVFHSHIEVYPYELGDSKPLEKIMSKWNGYTYVPFGLFTQNGILYLPRGLSTSLIHQYTGGQLTVDTRFDPYKRLKRGVMKYPPKSEEQENAIKFLSGEDDYSYTGRYSQLGLNLPTGDGKTFATIAAILKMKIRAIIITPQDEIRHEWYNDLTTKTTLPEEDICVIHGTESMEAIMSGKLDGEIFLVNHQTLRRYANTHGFTKIRDFFKKIKVGIKVIDEADIFFENTLMIDYFSNCYKSFYVTATFGRGDPAEIKLYNRAFASLVRYGEEVINDENRRKHIVCNIIYFRSKPRYGINPNVSTPRGFSSFKYIDYELKYEPNHTLLQVLYYILDNIKHLEGKNLILSPTKESVKYFANHVEEHENEVCGTIFSDNSREVNLKNRELDYISSTIKSTGRGVNIKGLRKLILLEPVSGKFLMDQVVGRLREYSSDMDTFMFYPVDMAIPECRNMINRVMPVLKKKCKEINTITLDL